MLLEIVFFFTQLSRSLRMSLLGAGVTALLWIAEVAREKEQLRRMEESLENERARLQAEKVLAV